LLHNTTHEDEQQAVIVIEMPRIQVGERALHSAVSSYRIGVEDPASIFATVLGESL